MDNVDHSHQSSSSSVASSEKKSLPNKKKLFIIGSVAILLLVFVFALFSDSQQKAKDTAANKNPQSSLPINKQQTADSSGVIPAKAAGILVYGVWSGQNSVIKGYDLDSGKIAELASLPLASKKVTILSPQSVLYIDQTDSRDHGKQLVVYDMKTKKSIATVPAAEGFGIDDYFVSPNKKYVAIWEVSFAQGSQVLQGGRSRVYAVDLSLPAVKQLLYDEAVTPTNPVHYPRAVLDNGTVFADTFLPNDPNGGAGWAYGMSMVDFTGKDKKDLTQLQEGTYGTQPSLSPDGKYLVFAGYDGTLGDGKAIKNGYRQALLTPNSVELLDTTTLARQKLSNLPNSNSYTSAQWDSTTGNIITTVIAKEKGQTGLYTYDITAKSMQKINLPKSETVNSTFLSMLPSGKILAASEDDSASALGNLGEGYAPSLIQLYTLDSQSPNAEQLTIQEPLVQYIATLPQNYFQGVLGVQATNLNPQPTLINLYSDQSDGKDRLQLYTFFIKSELSTTRLTQQTNPPQITVTGTQGSGGSSSEDDDDDEGPKCEDLAAEQCRARGLTDEESQEFDDCADAVEDSSKDAGKCHDSPLYLYGEQGQQVNVAIQTPISNAIPSSAGTYAITLGENGNFTINGKSYASIAYDYVSNLKRIVPPQKGMIAARVDVEKVLRHYASKFGLNEEETADLVQAGKTKATSPYVFISFFDQKTSEQILPITFSPKPDNYLNVVFYFKNLKVKPNYTPATPDFPAPVTRNGFTAIEVSEIVE